jgi:hypothetical protein
MTREIRWARWLFAVVPLAAISLGVAASLPVGPKQLPETWISGKNCSKWPYPVYCYHYGNDNTAFGCFATLCEAAAAGYSRCTTNLHGTCD